jgi:hypothetical protein
MSLLPTLDRAVLGGAPAQIAQLMGPYVSKTDQTAQTDQRIETIEQFDSPPGHKLTSGGPKLTSGTAQQPSPLVQVIGASLESARVRPSDGALQS